MSKQKSIRCGVSVHLSKVSLVSLLQPAIASSQSLLYTHTHTLTYTHMHVHTQVEWKDGTGVSMVLDGLSVFVRACVLGQLQHSHLHCPAFPLTLNQTLSFDRVS